MLDHTMNRTLAARWLFIAMLLLSGMQSAAAVPLELMAEDAAAPWSESDGSGYANEVVKAAFASVGVEVKLKVVPYARCKAMVLAGKIAGCFNMSQDLVFNDIVVFSDKPIFTVRPVYFRRETATSVARAEKDIPSGALVGVVTGYEYPDSVDVLKKKGVLFDNSNSEVTILKKLSLGRLDYALLILDGIKTEAILKREAGIYNVVPAFSGNVLGSFIGFSTLHPQGNWAREQYNRGYTTIQKNGTLGKINVKWHVAS